MKAALRRDANSITEGVIWKQLLLFFFPILLGTFFQQLYNTVDAMVVGKAVGTEALAAVGGATGTIINLLVGFFVGLSSGATVIISQFYGGRREHEVHMAVHTAAAMAIAFGALLMAVGIPMAPTFLRWMGTPDEVLGYAVPYMRIYFAGMIPSLIYNIGSGILRAVGDSKRPLYFLIAACLTNIVLDLVLVVACGMGVSGAALATILSQSVSAVLVVLSLRRTDECYRLDPGRIRFHLPVFRSIMRIGLPSGLQSVSYSVSNVMIQAAINGFGTAAMAGWTTFGKLDAFFWMIVNAFGVSITTFVGQNFGAGRYDRVRSSVRQCLLMTAIATIAISSLLYCFGDSFLRLFTDDAAVIERGMYLTRLLAPTWITYITIEILSGALRGAGDALVPTMITLIGVCAVRIVWLLTAVPLRRELGTVAFSYPLTWVISSIAFILYYLKGSWLKRCIQKAGFQRDRQEM